MQPAYVLAGGLFGFSLDSFFDYEFLESVDMDVGSFSCGFGIFACYGVHYHGVFFRHMLSALEIVIVNVSESQNQLPGLLAEQSRH